MERTFLFSLVLGTKYGFFPFDAESKMWDLIVPDHCLSFTLGIFIILVD